MLLLVHLLGQGPHFHPGRFVLIVDGKHVLSGSPTSTTCFH